MTSSSWSSDLIIIITKVKKLVTINYNYNYTLVLAISPRELQCLIYWRSSGSHRRYFIDNFSKPALSLGYCRPSAWGPSPSAGHLLTWLNGICTPLKLTPSHLWIARFAFTHGRSPASTHTHGPPLLSRLTQECHLVTAYTNTFWYLTGTDYCQLDLT